MATDFEELFEDIMYYARKKLGAKEFKTKEELEEYIKESDKQKKIKDWVLKELVETNKAQEVITKATEEQAAISAELQRSLKSRLLDESKTAKDVREITKKTLAQWRKNPARFDLKGVDTRTKELILQEIRARIRKAKAAGYRVGRRGLEVYRIEADGKRYRSLLTGRFVKKRP